MNEQLKKVDKWAIPIIITLMSFFGVTGMTYLFAGDAMRASNFILLGVFVGGVVGGMYGFLRVFFYGFEEMWKKIKE